MVKNVEKVKFRRCVCVWGGVPGGGKSERICGKIEKLRRNPLNLLKKVVKFSKKVIENLKNVENGQKTVKSRSKNSEKSEKQEKNF